MSYNTLDSVVRSYLADTGRTTLHKYLRYMKWAMDGLKKWHINGNYEDKTVMMKMDKKKSVPYPEDMVIWSKIGVKVGDRMVQFNKDDTITLHHTQANNYQKANDEYNPANQWPELESYYWDGGLGSFYSDFNEGLNYKGFGRGHNGVGYFTENNQCKEFQFSSEVTSSEIVLVYRSSGFNPSAETEVNEIANELLRDYMRWQEGRFKYGDSAAETQFRKKEYGERYSEVRDQLMYITYEGIMDILRRTTDINR